MKTAKYEQLTIPEWDDGVSGAKYSISEKTIEQVKHAREMFYQYDDIFCMTFQHCSDLEIQTTDEEFRYDGVYLEVYSTGGIYIVFYEKHNDFKYQIHITDDLGGRL